MLHLSLNPREQPATREHRGPLRRAHLHFSSPTAPRQMIPAPRSQLAGRLASNRPALLRNTFPYGAAVLHQKTFRPGKRRTNPTNHQSPVRVRNRAVDYAFSFHALALVAIADVL